jgi:hypothetical protein
MPHSKANGEVKGEINDTVKESLSLYIYLIYLFNLSLRKANSCLENLLNKQALSCFFGKFFPLKFAVSVSSYLLFW